ncbi:MAG: TetR/AcrR family transcriptional regulator [Gemmatimonadota bacterium]
MPLQAGLSSSGRRTWKRRSHARPEEIRDAALHLFGERGFAATKIEDIAEKARVTVGTVYRYFRDKEALLGALIEGGLGSPLPSLGQDGELSARLRTWLGDLWTATRGEPHASLLRIVVSDGNNFPELVTRYREGVLEPAVGRLAEFLRTERLTPEPMLAARAAIAQLLGASILSSVPSGRHPLFAQPAPQEHIIAPISDALLSSRSADPVEPALARSPRSRRAPGPDAW